MEIVYKNNRGEAATKTVERFDIRGTIMNTSVTKVGTSVVHRLYVEDGKGNYVITIWDSATGYDASKLKAGYSVKFRGLLHKQYYYGEDGVTRYFPDYKAQEMQA